MIINGKLPEETRIEDDMGSIYTIKKDADGYIYVWDYFIDEEANASIFLNTNVKYRVISKSGVEDEEI